MDGKEGLSNHQKFLLKPQTNAFTLVELIVVVALIGVLASLLTLGFQHSLRKTEAANCMSNLRGLYTGLSSLHLDLQQWPQLPEHVVPGTIEEEEFWIETLKPYGLREKDWKCRTQERLLKSDKSSGEVAKIHYIPALFDSVQMRPRLWVQPWVMEIGDVHGNGNHVLLSDGSVRTYRQVFEGVLASGKKSQ